MKTYLVTGNDTGIGKTRVVASLAQYFLEKGFTDIQLVKPVESSSDDDGSGDVITALELLNNPKEVTGHTCFRFQHPLSPHTAAKKSGKELTLKEITNSVEEIKKPQIRIIEGAGGIASPYNDDGANPLDLAKSLKVDGVILVVENRLGAINQAKLLERYTQSTDLNFYFWLNETKMQHEDVLNSNLETIKTSEIPILATLGFEEIMPTNFNEELLS